MLLLISSLESERGIHSIVIPKGSSRSDSFFTGLLHSFSSILITSPTILTDFSQGVFFIPGTNFLHHPNFRNKEVDLVFL